MYLDFCSTTPVDPRVFEVMHPWLTNQFGNSASTYHAYGRSARNAVESAREQVARAIEARTDEIIFTSGCTEGNNWILQNFARPHFGAANADPSTSKASSASISRLPHFITTTIEHKSVLAVAQHLLSTGQISLTLLKPDNFGRVAAAQVLDAVTADTRLVSVIAANNEIGTLNPIAQIGAALRARGILFHSDATQWIGKLPFSVKQMPADFVTCSAHKFYGPQGVGFVYVNSESARKSMNPFMFGGGHERGLRAGTQNVAGIVGLGKSAEIVTHEMASELPHAWRLHAKLKQALRIESGSHARVRLNGHPDERIPQNLNVSFIGVGATDLMLKLPHIAMSSGSACLSASQTPSHVLTGIGLSLDDVQSSLRLSFGRTTTEQELENAGLEISKACDSLRM